MLEIIRSWLAGKPDFTTRVLRRYRSKKPVSALAREISGSETTETINLRFARARRKVEQL